MARQCFSCNPTPLRSRPLFQLANVLRLAFAFLSGENVGPTRRYQNRASQGEDLTLFNLDLPPFMLHEAPRSFVEILA
ncbi:hypothetical protein D1O30_20105 [Methylocystis hirsuta]|uniref:Uncharacterized protein n=1 Tax=Methylocystis hirsuta TaxID=369798 RepID=A0A3M9XJR8_9HYPH|nr:hypothetical protein D1O30_20105 [Methylocystis hirsuta]